MCSRTNRLVPRTGTPSILLTILAAGITLVLPLWGDGPVRRPVPTRFTAGSALDDLIYYPPARDPEQVLASLPTGETVLSEDDLLGSFVPENNPYGSVEAVEVSAPGSSKALRVSVRSVPKKPYEFQATIRSGGLKDKARGGDAMLLVLSMRTVQGGRTESQAGQIQCIVAETGGSYEKTLTADVIAGRDWVTVYFPFTFQEKRTGVTIRFGYHVQTVEIAGFRVINYRSAVKLEDLPKNRQLPCFEKDAPWRAEALARIEKVRKGDITVSVKDAAGNAVPDAQVSLQMYEHEFQFGSAVNRYLLSPGSRYPGAVAELFNSAVLENELKWCVYDADPKTARDLVAALQRLGVRYIRGTTLVWDRVRKENDTVVPADLPGLYRDRNALDKRIRDHILDVAGAFKGELVDWDVLNETTANNEMIKVQGRDIIKNWFQWARQADANAVRYYNDYLFNDATFALFDWMVAQQVDLEGIGIQSHMDTAVDPAAVYAFYNKLAAYGKRLKVTEFDANIADPYQQAAFFRDMLIITFSHEAFDGFYLWGFRNWPEQNLAVLYSDTWKAKPGYDQYTDLVYNKWWTKAAGKTGADGVFTARGFYGEYDVSVSANGRTKTVPAVCRKGKRAVIEVVMP